MSERGKTIASITVTTQSAPAVGGQLVQGHGSQLEEKDEEEENERGMILLAPLLVCNAMQCGCGCGCYNRCYVIPCHVP